MTRVKLALVVLFGVFLIYVGGWTLWYGSPDVAKDLSARVVGAIFALLGLLVIVVSGYELLRR